MHKNHKTKSELLKELAKLRQRVDELKKSEKELKKAKETLRESEEMYKALLGTSFDSIAIHKIDSEILEISGRSIKMLGFKSANELIGKSGLFVIAPEDHEKANMIHQKILDEGFVRNVELTFQKKNGMHFYAEINATLIKDSKGNPKGIIGATRDITERKKAEKLLRESEKNLQKEVRNLRQQIQKNKSYPEIIGSSPKILKLIDLVNQIARTNSTVLIYGETGSGKDLIAKAIHYSSPRKNAPFLAINCAALPEQLVESELFGYVKGAFTGATQDKKGLFEDADKGTLFLNEVGEIPLRLQAKLLQVLENQQIRRLGQSKNIKIDVRIIAASNINLEEAANNGTFRKDLFFRLNVLPITIPPLRERKDDIPLLAKHFLDRYCPLMNKQIKNISQEAMDLLCNYPYPGNVREMENIIQHSIVISKGSTIIPQDLPESLRKSKSIPTPESLADMEKRTIVATIQECNGKLNCVAKKLGIHRSTLWRKMKRFGIREPN
jgi:PAS domain S-box-containing protein